MNKKTNEIKLASRNLRTTVTKKGETRRRESLMKLEFDELTSRTNKDEKKSHRKIEKC